VGSHFDKDSGESQGDTMMQELQHPADNISIFGGVESWVFTRSHPVLQFLKMVCRICKDEDGRCNIASVF